MSTVEVLVVAAGAVLIAWELWFFLASRPRAVVVPSKLGVQEVRIVVREGFDPDTIAVEAGRPVRLNFYRNETAECSERVVFDTLGIDQALPAFQHTAIEFTPTEPGDYPFRCGMAMLRGRVVAQVGREGARANLGRGHTKHG